jgi:hypothetical protein
MSSVQKPLKLSAEASICVLGAPSKLRRPFWFSATGPFAALVRAYFLHGDRAFWKTKIQLWNGSVDE